MKECMQVIGCHKCHFTWQNICIAPEWGNGKRLCYRVLNGCQKCDFWDSLVERCKATKEQRENIVEEFRMSLITNRSW